MNASTRFYALTISLATVVTVTLPADAASLGTFVLEGVGTTQDNKQQYISGSFNQDFTDYSFRVTVSPNQNGGLSYSDAGIYNTQGFNSTDNFDTKNIGHAWSTFAKLNIFSEDTLKVDLLNFQLGDVKSVFWKQFGVTDSLFSYSGFHINPDSYITDGFGTATISMLPSLTSEPVPEPSEILGSIAAGALLLGWVVAKRRKLVKGKV